MSGSAAAERELWSHRFTAVAREMGELLRRTALSTNVKERLDFSCAVLDASGYLVVNAPHIPVHLGALGICVRAVAGALPLLPGDTAVTNHPAYGGSHLPDVTLVTPVDAGGELVGYVANRAHHAEIGGARPGSMPPAARCLAEEGVVLKPTYLARGGVPRWDELRRLLLAAPYPTRAVEENLADLEAQAAANHRGAEVLRALAARHGIAALRRQMSALHDHAEARLRAALAGLPAGVYTAREELDDGSPLVVRIELGAGEGTIDFSGSAPVHPGNLNATPAVVRSVVLYVLRLLVAARTREPLPLNEGLLRPLRIELPPGLLNPPFPDDPLAAPAVVGGNVETSQRLVDTLLKALRLCAGSQGTMNNVLFGSRDFGYYETVAGGCGAGPGFDGASAVHSHMTNTRSTDPEVLEHRYPVRLERFAVRRGSGGGGRFRGGDGVVRELTFLQPMSLSIVSQHRREGPFGMEGGEPGLPGAQRVVRASGEVVTLGAVDGCEVGPGDRLVLETPGGGGWGYHEAHRMSEPTLVATDDDDDLLEAVFRYQFAHNASQLKEGAAVYGLALRGDHDPSEEFLRRFADHLPPVAKASRCALTEGGAVEDRETGAPALLFRVTDLRRLSDDEAEARGEYLEDRLSGAASVYRLAREDRRWVVKEDRMKWIS